MEGKILYRIEDLRGTGILVDVMEETNKCIKGVVVSNPLNTQFVTVGDDITIGKCLIDGIVVNYKKV